MSMSRKHLRAITEEFAYLIDNTKDKRERQAYIRAAERMSSVFCRFNDRFERSKFLYACHALDLMQDE